MASNNTNPEELINKFYRSILHTILRLSEIENKHEIKTILLSSLHQELKDLLWLLTTPDEREDLSYDSLLKILMNHLQLDYNINESENHNCNEVTEPIKEMNIINKRCTINKQKNIIQNLIQPELTIRNPFPFKMGNKLYLFTGRQEQLNCISYTLKKSKQKIVVVHGLSGIGKSALVNEYAWLNMHYYNQTIAWFDVKRLELDFLELAGELTVSTKTTEQNYRPICQIKKDIYNCLKKKSISLLIFDDALTEEDIKDYLPVNQQIDVLITSPQGNWNSVDKVQLPPLTLTESETVLKQIVVNKLNKSDPQLNEAQQLNLKNQSKEISDIVELIDGIPVAVEICGAYIAQQYHLRGSNVNLLQYIKELTSVEVDFEEQSDTYEKNVYISFDVTYKKLCSMKNISLFFQEISDILNICAYLNSSGIPISLIEQISEIEDTDTLLTIFRILADFSLITYNYGEFITIHNLIQNAIIFSQKKVNEDSKWYVKVLVYLLDNCEYYIDQIISVLTYAEHHLELIMKLLHKYDVKLIRCIVFSNNLVVLKYILDKIENPKDLVQDSYLLHFAASSGKIHMVEYLLNYSDVDHLDDYGFNAIQLAIQDGHLEITILFLTKYPHLAEVKHENGNTLLHIASKFGHTHICEIFLSKYKFEAIPNYNGDYPIHLAIQYNHPDLIELFITKTSDLTIWTKQNGDNVLHIAAQYGHTQICKLLLNKYNFETTANNNNDYPIHKSIEYENLDIVDLFLDEASDLSKWTKENNETVIHTATRVGNIQILKTLMKNKYFDVNSANKNGFTPLILAAASGMTEAVGYLLSKGASAALCDKNNWSALMYATWRGHSDVVKLLVEAPECDVNAKNLVGFTPLHYACLLGNLSIIEILCNAGANVNVRNNNKQTPLDLISHNIQANVYEFLKQ